MNIANWNGKFYFEYIDRNLDEDTKYRLEILSGPGLTSLECALAERSTLQAKMEPFTVSDAGFLQHSDHEAENSEPQPFRGPDASGIMILGYVSDANFVPWETHWDVVMGYWAKKLADAGYKIGAATVTDPEGVTKPFEILLNDGCVRKEDLVKPPATEKRLQVPQTTAHVQFGPVSQVNIQAMPLSAEAREDPAAIAAECQQIADEFDLPVVLSCELLNRTVSRHTFKPQK